MCGACSAQPALGQQPPHLKYALLRLEQLVDARVLQRAGAEGRVADAVAAVRARLCLDRAGAAAALLLLQLLLLLLLLLLRRRRLIAAAAPRAAPLDAATARCHEPVLSLTGQMSAVSDSACLVKGITTGTVSEQDTPAGHLL